MTKKFNLPHGWYRRTVEDLFDHVFPTLFGDLTDETAWRYVYASVLWFERASGAPFLHLNDKLSTNPGKELAKRGEAFLEENLAPRSDMALSELIDQIGKRYAQERESQGFSAQGWQRNNVTGASFEATLQVLIHRLCGVLPSRSPDLRTLRGFELAPKGYHSRPDLALFSAADFRVLVSTKWTMRKERLGTFLHEAYFYRQRRADLQVAFVVSEFNLNILEHLVGDALVDRVYHVHLPMLLAAHEPLRSVAVDGAVTRKELVSPTRSRELTEYHRWWSIQERLFDLSDLFRDIRTLKAGAATDPELEDALDVDDEDP